MSGELQRGPSEAAVFETAEDALSYIRMMCESWELYDSAADESGAWVNLNWRAAARARVLLIHGAAQGVRS